MRHLRVSARGGPCPRQRPLGSKRLALSQALGDTAAMRHFLPALCLLSLLCVACDPGAPGPGATPSPATSPAATPSSGDYAGTFDFEAVVSLDPAPTQGAETFAVRGAEQLRAVQASLGPDDPLGKLTLSEGQTLLLVARPGSDSAAPELRAVETQEGKTRVRYALPGAAKGAMQRGPYVARVAEDLAAQVEFELAD